MQKKTVSATVQRSAKTGQYVVRKSSGETSTHVVKSHAASIISRSKEKHKDALRRLANR